MPSPLGISVFASSTHTFSFDKLLTSFSQCPVLSLLPAGYRASKPLSYVIDSQLGSWRATGYHNRSSVCDSLLASCVRLQQRQMNAAGCEGNRNDDSRRSRSRGESRIFDRDNASRNDQVISMFIHCLWKFLRFIFFSILLLSLRSFLLKINVSIDLWTFVWKSIIKQPFSHHKKLTSLCLHWCNYHLLSLQMLQRYFMFDILLCCWFFLMCNFFLNILKT